jgi:hypothetical protein
MYGTPVFDTQALLVVFVSCKMYVPSMENFGKGRVNRGSAICLYMCDASVVLDEEIKGPSFVTKPESCGRALLIT